MKHTVERLDDSSIKVSRRWWQVRGKLRTTLCLVCGAGVVAWFQPDFRLTALTTVLFPLWELLASVARWQVWPVIGLATAIAVPIHLSMRRARESRPTPPRAQALA